MVRMSNSFSQAFTTVFTVIALVVLGGVSSSVEAQQLSREVREKFQNMLSDLDSEIRQKFQNALDNNTSVVELTPEQFRRFRNSPANPFDINDVDPDDLDGNIELKFELPSLRNRPVQPYERQSRSLRRQLRSSVNEVRQSTVKITDGVEQIALGTVVRADGMIVTKASELDSKNKIYCHLGASKLYEATVLSRDDVNDVALLKIPRNDLKPVKWASTQPRNGSFVLTPNQVGEVVALGSYSVVARSTVGENQGFLGVAPQNATDGVQIAEPPESDTAAYAAGLRKGDVIMQIDETAVFEVHQLVYAIQQRQAGDKVSVKFKRQGLVMSATVKLAGRSLPPERAARFKMMSRLGAVPSDRKSEFPVVFQHDSPLFPEQCGGPICDLDGNVLGINIARETRASSFAIPSIHIQKVLDNLFRFDIAARDNQSR